MNLNYKCNSPSLALPDCFGVQFHNQSSTLSVAASFQTYAMKGNLSLFPSLHLTCCWNKWANRRASVCGGWRSYGEVELFNDRNSWLIRQVQWKVINPGKSTAAMRAVHFNLIRNQEFKGSSPFKPCPWYRPTFPPFSFSIFFFNPGASEPGDLPFVLQDLAGMVATDSTNCRPPGSTHASSLLRYLPVLRQWAGSVRADNGEQAWKLSLLTPGIDCGISFSFQMPFYASPKHIKGSDRSAFELKMWRQCSC